jgi:putative hemolysin
MGLYELHRTRGNFTQPAINRDEFYLPCASMYCTEPGEILLFSKTVSISFFCCSPDGDVIGELK